MNDLRPKKMELDVVAVRLDLLQKNVKKYGTVFNTVALGTELSGVLRRKLSTP